MRPNDAEGIGNGVDPEEQSDVGLHCLPWPVSSVRKLRIITYTLADHETQKH